MVLKGLGLAGPYVEASSFLLNSGRTPGPLYYFVRNSIAGAAQFAGTYESLEAIKEDPKDILYGAAFGAAIEGAFLYKALRSRAGSVVTLPPPSGGAAAGPPTGPLRLGPGQPPRITPPNVEGSLGPSSVPLMRLGPGRYVFGPSPRILGKEITLIPNEGKTAERMDFELKGLFGQEEPNVNQIITSLTRDFETSAIVSELDDATADLIEVGFKNDPSRTVVLRRRNQGKNELLVHNPVDEADILTPVQREQWKSMGVFENLEAIYQNRSFAYTGVKVAEGRVQIRDINNPGRVFAPKIEDVSTPINPKVYTESRRRVSILQEALRSVDNAVGFVIPSNKDGFVRRGEIALEGFEEGSIADFRNRYRNELRGINANTPEEAIQILANRRGIKGMVERQNGVITNVHIFDQGSVRYVKELPKAATREAMRLDRAKRMGFDVDTPLYHGTGQAFEQLKKGYGGVWLTRNPEYAAKYAVGDSPNIRPVFIKPKLADLGSVQTNITDGTVQRLRSQGYNGLKFRNINTNEEEVLMFDLKDVKSQFDQFGPAEPLPGPQYVNEALSDTPRFGYTPDKAVLASDAATGKMAIVSLEPSWQNTLFSSLRMKGISEKEITNFMSLYEKDFSNNKIVQFLDPEFRRMKIVSEGLFNGGCK